jgi:hypothetical protein
MANELTFKVVRMSKLNEVLAHDTNLLIARAAYGLAVELLPATGSSFAMARGSLRNRSRVPFDSNHRADMADQV